ncbi:hypothetical protein ABW20_dc0110516 [Dactylellina cionopaga]|nr:hypothetical protein ABW20_dc0110516 [Dactylellina cionopaga]
MTSHSPQQHDLSRSYQSPNGTLFESLPLDIKFIIFRNMPDYDSLMRLVLASRSFHAAFEEAKNTPKVLGNDACIRQARLFEESLFIAFHYRRLRQEQISEDSVSRTITQYNIITDKTLHEDPSHQQLIREYETAWNEEEGLQAIVIANHHSIVRLCDHLVRTFKYPKLIVESQTKTDEEKRELQEHYLKQDPPATVSERKKIIRALYRFWLMTLVYSADWGLHDGDRPAFPRPKEFVGNNSQSYPLDSRDFGYTDTRAFPSTRCQARFLQILVNWEFWDRVAIGAVMEMVAEALKPVSEFIEQEMKVNPINEASEADPSTSPPLRYYADGGLLAFIAGDFPHRTLAWIQNSEDPVKLSGILKATDHLRKPIRRSSDFQEYLHVMFQVGPPSGLYQRGEEKKKPRRICLRNDNIYYRQWDFRSGIWDDWRLKEWGYFMQPWSFLSPKLKLKLKPKKTQTRHVLVKKVVHGMDASRSLFKRYSQVVKRSERV